MSASPTQTCPRIKMKCYKWFKKPGVRRQLNLGDGSGDFRFDAAPADRPALHGAHHRAEQHHVHHLAVVKALQQQRPEQGPVLMLLQRERDHASEKVNQHESDEENEGTLNIGGCPNLGHVREVELRKPPE